MGRSRSSADSTDADDLGAVIALKRAQYAATGARDYFGGPGEGRPRAPAARDPGRRVRRHALHRPRRAAAARRAFRDPVGRSAALVVPRVRPASSPASRRVGSCCESSRAAAPSLGVTRLDLGRGDDEYKRRAKTGETVVCQGFVTESRTALATRRVRSALVDVAKSSSVARRLHRVARRRGR